VEQFVLLIQKSCLWTENGTPLIQATLLQWCRLAYDENDTIAIYIAGLTFVIPARNVAFYIGVVAAAAVVVAVMVLAVMVLAVVVVVVVAVAAAAAAAAAAVLAPVVSVAVCLAKDRILLNDFNSSEE
jgi:hypothetical protein